MLAMADPAKKRATYEDLVAVPVGKVAEIINGELVVHPRPASRHALSESDLGAELIGSFHIGRNGPGGWVILFEPELHLGDDVLVPDVAGWRRERMPEIPEVVGFTLPPDWLCEVLSPSTKAVDRADKLPIYARERVGNVWLIDPLAQTLEAFRLDGETYRLMGTWRDEARVRIEPFEALELELALLWRR
jgi:Uma2 family endonuclease